MLWEIPCEPTWKVVHVEFAERDNADISDAATSTVMSPVQHACQHAWMIISTWCWQHGFMFFFSEQANKQEHELAVNTSQVPQPTQPTCICNQLIPVKLSHTGKPWVAVQRKVYLQNWTLVIWWELLLWWSRWLWWDHPVYPELIARHSVVKPLVVWRYKVGVVVPAPICVVRPDNQYDHRDHHWQFFKGNTSEWFYSRHPPHLLHGGRTQWFPPFLLALCSSSKHRSPEHSFVLNTLTIEIMCFLKINKLSWSV